MFYHYFEAKGYNIKGFNYNVQDDKADCDILPEYANSGDPMVETIRKGMWEIPKK